MYTVSNFCSRKTETFLQSYMPGYFLIFLVIKYYIKFIIYNYMITKYYVRFYTIFIEYSLVKYLLYYIIYTTTIVYKFNVKIIQIK